MISIMALLPILSKTAGAWTVRILGPSFVSKDFSVLIRKVPLPICSFIFASMVSRLSTYRAWRAVYFFPSIKTEFLFSASVEDWLRFDSTRLNDDNRFSSVIISGMRLYKG